ncbi:PREDICTED: glutathione S-transferase T3-like [Erythranthe guttata]|uniref:glutathione S-transferase T3-like n=1 Tax=Erythranthe guttata TaxID=4155 RepID=UPI00064DAD4E|nr:PREDICTED: glutathione S-transferase T3-like [Erythranthe guttata]|eukprot:XP_012836528.1 PREDICTED: glutathione S-transferase T3-like [Erythranthe guttata]
MEDLEGSSRGRNFSSDEDASLCRAYIAISEDPLIGKNQSMTTMWKRIQEKFHELVPDGGEKRTAKSLKSHWTKINQSCTRFAECVAQITLRPRSGANAIDNLDDARLLYFNLDHCWTILQDGKKWRAIIGVQFSQSANITSSPNIFSSPSEYGGDSVPKTQNLPESSNTNVRPMGSSVETPERKAWLIEQQNAIIAKRSSRSLNFDDGVYHPEMPPSD